MRRYRNSPARFRQSPFIVGDALSLNPIAAQAARSGGAMLKDGKKNTRTGGVIARRATSAKPPTVGGKQLRNLAALLQYDNVQFVIVVGRANKMRVYADVGDGGTVQGKVFNAPNDGGLFVIMRLSDNPLGVGDGFFDLTPIVLDKSGSG